MQTPETESPNVVWLASYPKSGNTWVRFIVSHLLKGAVIERSGEIETYTPDVHKRKSEVFPHGPGTHYLKTHWRLHPNMPGYGEVTRAQRVRFDRGFGPLMKRLGY